jgi:hypothetical protein
MLISLGRMKMNRFEIKKIIYSLKTKNISKEYLYLNFLEGTEYIDLSQAGKKMHDVLRKKEYLNIIINFSRIKQLMSLTLGLIIMCYNNKNSNLILIDSKESKRLQNLFKMMNFDFKKIKITVVYNLEDAIKFLI